MPKPLARPHDLKLDDEIIEINNPDGTGITFNRAIEVLTVIGPKVANGPWTIVAKNGIVIRMAPNGRATLNV